MLTAPLYYTDAHTAAGDATAEESPLLLPPPRVPTRHLDEPLTMAAAAGSAAAYLGDFSRAWDLLQQQGSGASDLVVSCERRDGASAVGANVHTAVVCARSSVLLQAVAALPIPSRQELSHHTPQRLVLQAVAEADVGKVDEAEAQAALVDMLRFCYTDELPISCQDGKVRVSRTTQP